MTPSDPASRVIYTSCSRMEQTLILYTAVVHLCEASLNGNLVIVDTLLLRGAKVNIQDEHGETPLHLALFHGHDDVVDSLIYHGAYANIKNKFVACHNLFHLCKTIWPLTDDAFRSSVDCNLHKLLTDGADPDFRYSGSTPLCEASLNGSLVIVEYLLFHGAKVDIQNGNGETPLYLAAFHGHADVVEYLIFHRADANIENSQGYSPLMAALGNDYIDIAKFLTQKSGQVNIMYGDLPWIMYLITEEEDLISAKYALDAGTSPYFCDIAIGLGNSGIFLESEWLCYFQQLSMAGFKITLCDMDLLENWFKLGLYRHPRPFTEAKILGEYLVKQRKTVPPLDYLCRTRIRHELVFSRTKGHIRQKIDLLPLPGRLKTFLKLDED